MSAIGFHMGQRLVSLGRDRSCPDRAPISDRTLAQAPGLAELPRQTGLRIMEGRPMDPTPLSLPPKKAAARLGIGRTKLLELIADKRIDASKLDGRIRVSVASLDAFHAALPKVTP